MRDTTAIAEEFSRWTGHPNPPRPLETYWYDTDAMVQEIARLRTRVTWLETELDHSSYVVSMATEYCRTMKPEGLTMLSHAVRQYWENSLDDDGLDP